MITGELRNKIDRIWETFWTGGITNPLEVIEQFTYLLFIKGLDDKEIIKEQLSLLKKLDFSIAIESHNSPVKKEEIIKIIV